MDKNIVSESSVFLNATGMVFVMSVFKYARNFISFYQESLYTHKYIDSYSKIDKKSTDKINSILHTTSIIVKVLDTNVATALVVANGDNNDIFYSKAIKDMLSDDEFIAVLLHEYSHILNKDTLSSMHNSTLSKASTFFVAIMGLIFLPRFGKKSLIFIILFPLITKLLGSLAVYEADRNMEYAADKYTAKYGYAEHLATALEKLRDYSKKILCEGVPPEQCEIMFKILDGDKDPYFQQHPTFYLRIKRLREIIAKAAEGNTSSIIDKVMSRLKWW
jgi:Zn-dependent protease with chaperone function